MEMLKSEVKLLLLRNSQLENDNLLLKQNELNLNQYLIEEKRLTKVLESIKSAQNDYISKLNLLIIELTQDSDNQNIYNQIKKEIDSCIKMCKQLQHDYELCKQSVSNQKSLIPIEDSQQSIDTNIDSLDINEDFVYEELEDEEEDQQMPELDLIESQINESHNNNGTDVDDDDDDPNGAGEQYLDINDKEFVPKGTLPKNARKSFTFNDNRIQTTPKRRKLKEREFKTSHKFGDKFRCNWKGCVFISSYKQNVERHYRVHTGERPFKCQFKGCGFSASQAGNLKVHQQRHGHLSPNEHKIRVKSISNAVKMSPKKVSEIK